MQYVVFSIFHGMYLLHEPVDHDGVHGHYEQQRQEVAEDEEAQLKTKKNYHTEKYLLHNIE